MDTIIIILWIVWIILTLIAYHTIFEVYYFSLSHGLIKELFWAGFIGLLMTGLTLYFWYVAAVIILLIGLSTMSKTHNKVPLIIAIIAIIFIAIIGMRFRSVNMKQGNGKEDSNVSSEVNQIDNSGDESKDILWNRTEEQSEMYIDQPEMDHEETYSVNNTEVIDLEQYIGIRASDIEDEMTNERGMSITEYNYYFGEIEGYISHVLIDEEFPCYENFCISNIQIGMEDKLVSYYANMKYTYDHVEENNGITYKYYYNDFFILVVEENLGTVFQIAIYDGTNYYLNGDEGEQNSEYILPNSDSTYLSEADIEILSKDALKLARNEIYARHGRRFNDDALQGYFDSCSWYTGTILPEDFSESVLNEYEKANRDLITNYEKQMGYR